MLVDFVIECANEIEKEKNDRAKKRAWREQKKKKTLSTSNTSNTSDSTSSSSSESTTSESTTSSTTSSSLSKLAKLAKLKDENIDNKIKSKINEIMEKKFHVYDSKERIQI